MPTKIMSTTVPFNPLTEISVCISLKWCLNCPKTGVYASVQCELNTADITYIPLKY